MSDTPAHPEIVELAAATYLQQLESVAAEASPTGKLGIAARHLIQTHRAALHKRQRLLAAEVEFTRDDLSGMEEWQLLALLDQHALGLGHDDAPVIFMGTEEAYDPEGEGDLALACSLSVLWLCGSRPDVLARIDPTVYVKERTPPPRQYHLHPNDFYRADRSRGRGTWPTLARLLRPDRPQTLLEPPKAGNQDSSLGDLCYQIDVSAYPSKQALSGRKPNERRVQFLCRLVAAFDTASALIFHGGPLDEARVRIASSFLNRPVKWTDNPVKREWFAWDATSGRAVMHTYALNGAVRYSYLDLVRTRLRDLAPSAFTQSR